MLRLYCGEYFVSPIPLHLGFGRCSHNCWYCFANLNNPNRKADFKTISQGLNTAISGRNSGVVGQLLAKKYPVCVSNTCDPFSKSNKDVFFMVSDLLDHIGVRCAFQTKGGDGAEKFLLDYGPTEIYITITSDSDELSREIEPGAPPFSERFELAKLLRSKGYSVVIGINPYVPEWWEDIEGFLKKMAAADLRRIWAGLLHFQYKQIRNMPAAIQNKYVGLISRGKKLNDHLLFEEFDRMIAVSIKNGVNVFSFGHSELGNFWGDYFNLGFPFFPTLDGLRTDLENSGSEPPIALSFGAFNEWADVLPGFTSSGFKEYLNKKGKTLFLKGIPRVARSFMEVNELYWNLEDFQNIFISKNLLYLQEPSENPGELLYSQIGGRDVLVYTPNCESGRVLLEEVKTFIINNDE